MPDKDYIERDLVLSKIGDILCRLDLTAEQRNIVTELGNFIAELPREKICTMQKKAE